MNKYRTIAELVAEHECEYTMVTVPKPYSHCSCGVDTRMEKIDIHLPSAEIEKLKKVGHIEHVAEVLEGRMRREMAVAYQQGAGFVLYHYVDEDAFDGDIWDDIENSNPHVDRQKGQE